MPIQEPVLTVGQSLDDSLASSSSEEVVVPPRGPTANMTKKGLKEKIQAGVQGRVNDFWKEKIGHYVMQGDYLALIMEEGGYITWRSYLWDIPRGFLNLPLMLE